MLSSKGHMFFFLQMNLIVMASGLRITNGHSNSADHSESFSPNDVHLSQASKGKACAKAGIWASVVSTECKSEPPQEGPGTSPERIAVVFWKESFRGPNGLAGLMGMDKHVVACTPEAESIQRAISASHVRNVIEPLEDSGRQVDVFLSTSTCSNGMHTKLQDMYNEGRTRVVENHIYAPTGSQLDSASLTADMILKHLETNTQRYSSYLFWRYDFVPLQSLQMQNSNNSDGHTNGYLSWANDFFFAFNDLAMSIPGRMAPCLLKNLANQCEGMDSEAATHQYYECVTAELRQEDCATFHWPESAIYRGPIGASFWGESPARVCHFLHDDFGGPSCVAEDMAQSVCRHICSKRQHPETCLSDFWHKLQNERQKILDEGAHDDELEFGSKITSCPEDIPSTA